MSDEEGDNKDVLNLSNKNLKKLPKPEDAQNVRHLILDNNELQKIENIDCYSKVEKLSICKNQLLRMYGICRLHNVRHLNLSFNGILTIEGLKELILLTHLNLEGNSIKTIEHLNTNLKLEYLNLSENSIGSISDISFLKSLKELYLHGNRLTHLKQCDKYLPTSLETFTLARNQIADLNEICTLSNLNKLENFTINENPCLTPIHSIDGFDHRPFVLNWCMSLTVIDGLPVDPIESLKAEWLYSQGKGRQFRVGEQEDLAKYLSSVCPLLGKAVESEAQRKLRLILSKAQQHQRQLQEEISENSNNSGGNSPSSARKKPGSRIQSPRFSRLPGRQGSPDSMSNSYHGNTSSSSLISSEQTNSTNHLMQMTTSLIENIKNDSLLTQSFDGSFNGSGNHDASTSSSVTPRSTVNNYDQHQQQSQYSMLTSGGPLAAASRMVPVPETLMSPDCCPSAPSAATQRIVSSLNSQSQMKSYKTKENKNGSPKATRSPRLKQRNMQKSPILSPRKTNLYNANTSSIASHQYEISKSCSNDNQMRSRSHSIPVQHQVTPPDGSGTITSDDDSDNINIDKLKTIHDKAAQRNQQRKESGDIPLLGINDATETSAILIQRIWRGYHTRKKTKEITEKLIRIRTQEYLKKLSRDMEITKAQLENERKIQQLQMHAINALWKKISAMQPKPPSEITEANSNNDTCTDEQCPTSSSIAEAPGEENAASAPGSLIIDNNSGNVVTDLSKTCTVLTNQVQQLQSSMQDIVNYMSVFCNLPQENLKRLFQMEASNCSAKDSIATQTDIIAVHTPQLIESQKKSKNSPVTIEDSSRQIDVQLQSSSSLSSSTKPKNLSGNDTDGIGSRGQEKDSKNQDLPQLSFPFKARPSSLPLEQQVQQTQKNAEMVAIEVRPSGTAPEKGEYDNEIPEKQEIEGNQGENIKKQDVNSSVIVREEIKGQQQQKECIDESTNNEIQIKT